MCSCKYLAKAILIMINLIFLLAGLLMLAFGIVAKVKPNYIFNILKFIPNIQDASNSFDFGGIFTSSAIFMIILGAVVAAVGFFGCCGACCENKILLIIYIIVLVLVLCGEVALIIYSVVSPDKLKSFVQSVLLDSLKKVDQDITFVNDTLKLPTHGVSLGWAALQLGVQCCGAYNYTDYSSWMHNVNINSKTYNTTIPVSCCQTKEKIDFEKSYNTFDVFINIDDCLQGNSSFINKQNCYDSIYDLIRKSMSIAIGIAAGIAGAEIILIIAAICLCRQSGDKEK